MFGQTDHNKYAKFLGNFMMLEYNGIILYSHIGQKCHILVRNVPKIHQKSKIIEIALSISGQTESTLNLGLNLLITKYKQASLCQSRHPQIKNV